MLEAPGERSFHEALETALRTCARRGPPVAAFRADVDELKEYQDVFGLTAGDEALRRVGDRVAAIGLAIYRTGGDEVSLLCLETTWEEPCEMAETIRTRVEQLRIERGPAGHPTEQFLTVCVSCLYCPSGIEIPTDEFLRRLDDALAAAKRSGPNNVVWSRVSRSIPDRSA